MQLRIAILLFYLLTSCIAVTEFPIHVPFYQLFKKGFTAYGSENWLEAISYFEWSLLQREHHTNSTLFCLDKCNSADAQCSVDLCQISDHRSSYLLIRRFHCMTNCKGRKLRSIDYMKAKDYNNPPDEKALHPFVSGLLYDYLQFSYYRAGDIENSTRALRTWLAYSPENLRAKTGLRYILSQFKKGDTVPGPRDSPRFLSIYNRGLSAYSDGRWAQSVDLWESSLAQLLVEIERCSAACEDSAPAMSSILLVQQYNTLQLTTQLRCYSGCYTNATRIGGHDDLLFSLFFYLQYSYFKLQEVTQALVAAKTAQLINPASDDIDRYLNFYSEKVGAASTEVHARQDVSELMVKLELINSLTQISTELLPSLLPTEETDLSELELTQDSQNYLAGSRRARPLVLSPPTNRSASRVLVDNLLSEVECRQLVLLADQISIGGDGYPGSKFGVGSSPHTPFENFTGVTLDRALQAWESGQVVKKLVQVYLESAEKSRAYLESYFQLNTTLYFSYTHLVCRTAKDSGDQESRTDLSHPVHSDNCILQPDNSCLKIAPAYTWRDYSSLVYLSEEFEGGDFFFADRQSYKPAVQVSTNQCGRMVGFSAGEENLHGVLPVTEGKRCALALWFTLDKSHSEDRETLIRSLSQAVN